jgi:hypothetical protein
MMPDDWALPSISKFMSVEGTEIIKARDIPKNWLPVYEQTEDAEENERRNAIANLLEEWGLIKILNKDLMKDEIAPLHQIKIISFKEKDEWQLITKYNIGKKSIDY